MDYKEIIILVTGSTVLSTIINRIKDRDSNLRSYQAKYIIEECQKWRKNIKEKIVEFTLTNDEKELNEIKTFIVMSLNPGYKNDIAIIEDMENYLINKDRQILKRIEKNVAFLLKEDWERVKHEVGLEYNKIDRTNNKVIGQQDADMEETNKVFLVLDGEGK